MARERRPFEFWNRAPPTIGAMHGSGDAVALDTAERAEIMGYMPDICGASVVELGAGIGRFTGLLAERARTVLAVDFVQKFVDANKENNAQFNNITHVCSDAMALSFEMAQTDLFFVNWLFMYLDDPEVELLAHRLMGALRPGGYVYLRESCRDVPELREGGRGTYYVKYRTVGFYRDLFASKLSLCNHGPIQTYLTLSKSNFFWLFKKL